MKTKRTNRFFWILLLVALNFYGRLEYPVFSEYEIAKTEQDSAGNKNADVQKNSAGEESSSARENSNVQENSAAENNSKVLNKNISSNIDLGHKENSPLYFGNPSDSITDISAEENYLLEKNQFVISYNNKTHNPAWVAWHLSKDDLGDSDRSNTFRADTELPKEWYAVKKNDYQFSMYGFDRGHICPSADRTADSEDNSVTFLMTNMVPQAPDNNRIVWVALEKFERELALSGYELYIFAGPYGSGGSGDRGFFENISVTQKNGEQIFINVPSFTWKIILAIPEGDEDISRIDEDTMIICTMIPNENGVGKNKSWQNYVCSVNYIEEITGYDFFELLPDALEEFLESKMWSTE